MKTYTIPRNTYGFTSCLSLASEDMDREIKFRKGCKYAVLLAGYFRFPTYSTHCTVKATIKARNKVSDYHHGIIDSNGVRYCVAGDKLIKISNPSNYIFSHSD